MSRECPCIYFENDGKCRKFSDDNTFEAVEMVMERWEALHETDLI